MLGISGLERIANTASRFPTTYDTPPISRRMFLRGSAATTAAGLLAACENPYEPKIEPHDPTLKLSVDKIQIRGRGTVTVSGQATPGYQGASIDYVELNTGDGKPTTRHGANFSHSHIYQNPSQQPIKYDIAGTAVQSDGRTGKDSVSVTVDPARTPTIDNLALTPLFNGFDVTGYKYDVTASAQDGLYMKSIRVRTNSGYDKLHENASQSTSQTVSETIPMPASRGSLEKIVVEIEAKDEFGNPAKVTENIPLPTYVTFELVDILNKGNLIQSPSKLILEKDGRRQEIDVSEGKTTVRLEPGRYHVRFTNPNYWTEEGRQWIFLREKGSKVNLGQIDSGYYANGISLPPKDTSYIDVGAKDVSYLLGGVPKSYPMVTFFGPGFDDLGNGRDTPGSEYWPPGTTIRFIFDTRPSTLGQRPSERAIRAAERASRKPEEIVDMDGNHVYRTTFETTENPPPDGTPGTFICHIRDDLYGFDSAVVWGTNDKGYIKASIGYFVSGLEHDRKYLHEFFKGVMGANTLNSEVVPATVLKATGADNLAVEDLQGATVNVEFNPKTFYRPK